MSLWQGLGACFISSLVIGMLFVPIRRHPPTDGFFTQFFMCIGAFSTSFIIYCFIGFPGVHGVPMIGGAVWAFCNSFAIPIMSQIGMALYMLFAQSISCLFGWAISRFGLFGMPSTIPNSTFLNYFGIGLLIIGSFIYPFVKITNHNVELPLDATDKKSSAKILAWIGTIITGLGLGVMTTPVSLVMDRKDLFTYSPDSSVALHFSFMTGLLMMSILVFVCYSVVRKSSPSCPSFIVLPSIISGIFFSTAICFFFIANESLSPTISYPICMMAPGLVTSAWSVFYFKEISGTRNFILLAIAYFFTLAGVISITISK